MKTRYVIALVGIILLMMLGICGWYIWIDFEEWVSYSPSEYPLQTAEALLQTIATRTPEPNITPELGEIVSPQCKDLLQNLMMRNNNQYILTVFRVYGNHGTPSPSPTGADEVLLHVTFPDGSLVELYFYALTLSSCRTITQ
jgi:hypothetical protein